MTLALQEQECGIYRCFAARPEMLIRCTPVPHYLTVSPCVLGGRRQEREAGSCTSLLLVSEGQAGAWGLFPEGWGCLSLCGGFGDALGQREPGKPRGTVHSGRHKRKWAQATGARRQEELGWPRQGPEGSPRPGTPPRPLSQKTVGPGSPAAPEQERCLGACTPSQCLPICGSPTFSRLPGGTTPSPEQETIHSQHPAPRPRGFLIPCERMALSWFGQLVEHAGEVRASWPHLTRFLCQGLPSSGAGGEVSPSLSLEMVGPCETKVMVSPKPPPTPIQPPCLCPFAGDDTSLSKSQPTQGLLQGALGDSPGGGKHPLHRALIPFQGPADRPGAVITCPSVHPLTIPQHGCTKACMRLAPGRGQGCQDGRTPPVPGRLFPLGGVPHKRWFGYQWLEDRVARKLLQEAKGQGTPLSPWKTGPRKGRVE